MSSLTGNMGYGGATGSPMKEKIPGGYKKASLQQFTPEMMQLFQQMFAHVGPESFLSKLASGDQSQFEQLEAPAMKQFGQLQAGLASRFSGAGMGSRRSSGFQNASNQAAADFAQQLQSQRLGLQKEALSGLGDMSSMLLGQRPFENALVEKPKSFLHEAGVGFASGFGKGLGSMAGGGA